MAAEVSRWTDYNACDTFFSPSKVRERRVADQASRVGAIGSLQIVHFTCQLRRQVSGYGIYGIARSKILTCRWLWYLRPWFQRLAGCTTASSRPLGLPNMGVINPRYTTSNVGFAFRSVSSRSFVHQGDYLEIECHLTLKLEVVREREKRHKWIGCINECRAGVF